ncbi:hypothetical protein ACIBQ1_09565 [Nonomuraea sp. NPDC050153]|uniref:hypothetical protein n=1 Tax=Nonomuraea sp. NPDC050153 TaxID=3364359 RepID=UPI0037A01D2B
MSDITSERVAAAVCEGVVGGWRDSLAGALSVTAEDGMLSLSVARWDADDTETVRHYRAVVVPGETEPIVLPRPDLEDGLEFEGEPYDNVDDSDGWQVCAAGPKGRTTGLKYADSILFRGCGHISTAEARRFAAALVAKADAVEAAQAELNGGGHV